MLLNPCQIIYDLAGSPNQEFALAQGQRCCICAQLADRVLPTAKWMGANYTDQNKMRFPESTWICEPCAWVHGWNAPPGVPNKEGAKRGANLRLFAHLWDAETGYLACPNRDRATILPWLLREHRGPWFAALPTSGKKHLLPWTPMNHAPSGLVRVEERNAAWDALTIAVLNDITAILAMEIPRGQVDCGEYSDKSWKTGMKQLAAFECQNAKYRGSARWTLALWLAPSPIKEKEEPSDEED